MFYLQYIFCNGYNGDCNSKSPAPLQRLITLFWLCFTFKTSFCNGSNGDCNGESMAPLQITNRRCNGNQRHRWKPLQRWF
jgi:hypothetical protein